MTGILVTRFAPEAEGHGTDAAIRAFHGDGRIRRRVPLVKAVTAILTISTGGSAGREGPSAQISAGFGSMVADMLGLSPRERRIAMTTGIGAGIGTIFKAPLGGAVLAAEVLYTRDFESDAIVPAFLASVIGYAIFGFFEGYTPIFALGPLVWNVWQIPVFLLLGVLCAAFGLLYIFTFYWSRDRFTAVFKRYNLPMYLKPVSGAILLGILVIALSFISPEGEMLGLASLGSSYGFDQLMIYSMVPLAVLILLPFLKILATSLTLGSGGSGGVFAPGLTIGAAIGGAFGMILHLIAPAYVPDRNGAGLCDCRYDLTVRGCGKCPHRGTDHGCRDGREHHDPGTGDGSSCRLEPADGRENHLPGTGSDKSAVRCPSRGI